MNLICKFFAFIGQKDAARYRWLREHFYYGGDYKHRLDWYLPRCYDGRSLKQQLDDAVDAAIRRGA